jgi:hypothetical protein
LYLGQIKLNKETKYTTRTASQSTTKYQR